MAITVMVVSELFRSYVYVHPFDAKGRVVVCHFHGLTWFCRQRLRQCSLDILSPDDLFFVPRQYTFRKRRYIKGVQICVFIVIISSCDNYVGDIYAQVISVSALRMVYWAFEQSKILEKYSFLTTPYPHCSSFQICPANASGGLGENVDGLGVKKMFLALVSCCGEEKRYSSNLYERAFAQTRGDLSNFDTGLLS